jgi:hypothetical protein
MNNFKNPWEFTDEQLSNPWELGKGRNIIDMTIAENLKKR